MNFLLHTQNTSYFFLGQEMSPCTVHFRHTSKGMDTLERAWFVAWCAKRIGLARLVCRFSWGKKWCINHNCMVIKVLALGKTPGFLGMFSKHGIFKVLYKSSKECLYVVASCTIVFVYLCISCAQKNCWVSVYEVCGVFLQYHLNADPLKRLTRSAIVLILILSKIKQCSMTKTFLFLSKLDPNQKKWFQC